MKSFQMPILSMSLLGLSLLSGLDAPLARADFTFGEPVNLKSVIPEIDPMNESIDCLSFDGLEIYFTSYRSGGQGNVDLWVLKRGSTTAAWGLAENLGPAVNTSNGDQESTISRDGLTLYFTSNRPGGSGGYDIYMTTRATKNDRWGQAVRLGPAVNSSAQEGCPWISPDGLEFYFRSNRSGGYGNFDIYVARRATTDAPWGQATNLGPVVNSPYAENYFSLSPDGLLLLFSDQPVGAVPRPGGYGKSDMWMTRRATLLSPWEAPVNLGPRVNSPADEILPRLSPDGSTLYFARSSGGVWTNWQASVMPNVDFSGDGKVDLVDLVMLIENWGTNNTLCDIGPMPWGDGVVDKADLEVLMSYWGQEWEVYDPTLVARWKLDETEGDIANDSARDFHGSLIGGPVWQPTAGKVNGALQLDGVDDYVGTPFVLSPAQGAFSVFAWVKGGAPGQAVLSQADGMNWLMLDAANGMLMTELRYMRGRAAEPPLLSQTLIVDGVWHRIGFVWDGSNRKLYVDGVEVAKDTQTGLEGSTGGLYIGSGKGLESGSFWSGLIDDVRIYNRAVTP